MHFARIAKLTPAQYVRQHESLILDTAGSSNTNGSISVGEPFEIFQPTAQERDRDRHDSSSNNMGVKEQAKRRLSPEGRVKDNSPEEPPTKRHQPLISPSISARLSPAAITPALLHTPVTTGGHHHASSSSSLHSHLSAQTRAALLEAERERERDRETSSLFHSNGLSREMLPNGRGIVQGHSAEHHSFERDRYASTDRYEKEYFGRPVPMFYSDLQRNYAEELSRDMEEEWKNIYTVSFYRKMRLVFQPGHISMLF